MRGGILQLIEWNGQDRNVIVHKFATGGRQVNKGSKLTVREGQAAIFCVKGRMADVFPPGFYNLDTGNIPVLTRIMGWKYGFQSPIVVDIFFVNTTQFTNQKWGTVNPILTRDKDFGAVKIRGFGSYSFKIDDPFKFMTELSGTSTTFATNEITDYLRGKMLMGVTAAIGESKVPVLDMAGNLMALSKSTEEHIKPMFAELGIGLTRFIFESFSLPEELQKAMMQNSALGMQRQNFDMHLANRQMDVMGQAAGNPGAGGPMNAMMGMGMGVGMGNMMGNMMNQGMQNVQGFGPQAAGGVPQGAGDKITCPHCNAQIKAGARFCPECGKPPHELCPKCSKPTKPNARFCAECGQSLVAECANCKKPLKAGARFCVECGTSVK
ncbi:MAG: SPFH domain-containing protein [Firmicutes bacterium]|nr:SPFH domain-containing protein [Bacillota bacterium]